VSHDRLHDLLVELIAGGAKTLRSATQAKALLAKVRPIYGHLMKSSAADQVEVASKLVTRYRREQSVSNPTESADGAGSSDQE
jgi:hypothetical protein